MGFTPDADLKGTSNLGCDVNVISQGKGADFARNDCSSMHKDGHTVWQASRTPWITISTWESVIPGQIGRLRTSR